MDDSSIYKAYYACIGFFHESINNIPETWLLASVKRTLEDTLDKYNMWAGNLGANNCGQQYRKQLISATLASRLAIYKTIPPSVCSPTIFQRILTLMKGDRPFGEGILSSYSDAVETKVWVEEEEEEEEEEEDSPWEVSSDSEAGHSPAQKSPIPAFQEINIVASNQASAPIPGLLPLVESASYIVKCLWRLPIRRPIPLDRMRERAAADSWYYQSFDVLHVRNKFPQVEEVVATRLGRMISRRRQLIQYRKSHTDRLQEWSLPLRASSSQLTQGMQPKGINYGDTDELSKLAPSIDTPSQVTRETSATTFKQQGPLLDLYQSQSV